MNVLETKLKIEIAQAFDTTRYPGDSNVVKTLDYPEPFELWEKFRGREWKDISPDEVMYWRMNLPNFSDQGFAYYFPAYLLAAIDDQEGEIEWFVICSLIPPDEDFEKFDQRMRQFNDEQRGVIAKYVLIYLDDNPYSSRKFAMRVRAYWNL